MSVTKKFTGRSLPFPDLVQEGCLALYTSAKGFDYKRDYRFSTYATWGIRQRAKIAVDDSDRTIRIPVHTIEKIDKMKRISKSLFQDLGREPTQEEIAKKMNLEITKVRRLKIIGQKTLSLDYKASEDEGSGTLKNVIEDKTVPSPYITMENKALSEEIGEALKKLTEKEATVITLRFGLENGNEHSFQQIGDGMGLTRERIRQINEDALKKLRHPRRSEKLRTFYENSFT